MGIKWIEMNGGIGKEKRGGGEKKGETREVEQRGVEKQGEIRVGWAGI